MNKKRTMPGIISTAILCVIFWMIITGQIVAVFTGGASLQSIVIGLIVSILVGWFSSLFLINDSPFYLWMPARLVNLIGYIFITLPVAIFKANVDVAKRALSPHPKINPGIVKIPVDVSSDYGMALVADSITLTPGTVTMDIVEENGQTYYYVHWIDVETTDPVEAGEIIKGTFERKVKGIWG